MSTPTQSPKLSRDDYREGRKFRVVKEGGKLTGMQPTAPYVQQGWGKDLPVGTILTCAGVSMSFGDGVPLVKWKDENGQWLANDCEFTPSQGGMWASYPADGYLLPIV